MFIGPKIPPPPQRDPRPFKPIEAPSPSASEGLICPNCQAAFGFGEVCPTCDVLLVGASFVEGALREGANAAYEPRAQGAVFVAGALVFVLGLWALLL